MFIVNTEAAIFRDGKYLLIRRSEKEEHAGGKLSLVGGKVDIEGFSSDILERTIAREVAEEVGLKLTARPRYIQSTSFVTDTGQDVVNVYFLYENPVGDPYIASADEVDGIYWLLPDEILNHTELPEYLKESIEQAEALRKLTQT